MKQLTWKQKDPAKVRQFTRQDVENCFNTFWGAAFRASGTIVTIKDVALISDLTPPTWRVDFCLDSPATGFHYHDAVLLIQHSWITPSGHQEYYLTAPKEQDLPTGCTSVTEEDAWVRQQRCAAATQAPTSPW